MWCCHSLLLPCSWDLLGVLWILKCMCDGWFAMKHSNFMVHGVSGLTDYEPLTSCCARHCRLFTSLCLLSWSAAQLFTHRLLFLLRLSRAQKFLLIPRNLNSTLAVFLLQFCFLTALDSRSVLSSSIVWFFFFPCLPWGTDWCTKTPCHMPHLLHASHPHNHNCQCSPESVGSLDTFREL